MIDSSLVGQKTLVDYFLTFLFLSVLDRLVEVLEKCIIHILN